MINKKQDKKGASTIARNKENLILLNEWMATIANKFFMQTEGRGFRSQSYNANAVQLKDHSRYDILDIPWIVPINK